MLNCEIIITVNKKVLCNSFRFSPASQQSYSIQFYSPGLCAVAINSHTLTRSHDYDHKILKLCSRRSFSYSRHCTESHHSCQQMLTKTENDDFDEKEEERSSYNQLMMMLIVWCSAKIATCSL